MHTSTVLRPGDFRYEMRDAGVARACGFADFCPDYHPLDRVAVVWSDLHGGLFGSAYPLLAITTAFYESLRSRHGETPFFDYPQHFCIKADADASVSHGIGDAARPWSMLDVWPENRWKVCEAAPAALLRAIFDLQINRVFWPAAWWNASLSGPAAPPSLPDHIHRMLATSLKQVHLYGTRAGDVVVHGSDPAEDIVAGVIDHLPTADAAKATLKAQRRAALHRGDLTCPLKRVTPAEFLAHYGHCFVTPEPIV